MKTSRAFLLTLLALAPGVWAGPPSAATNAASSGPAVSGSYRLVPMDRVAYKNDIDPSPNNTTQLYPVNSRGDLEILVSRGYDDKVIVHASGRTVAEVKKDLQARLEAQYYRTSNITLYLDSTTVRPGTVVFYGEIKGNMQLPPGQPRYLSESILDMKPSEFANLSKVKVIRHDSVTGKAQKPVFIDVEKILSKGERDKDLILQDGDYIYITAKMFNFK